MLQFSFSPDDGGGRLHCDTPPHSTHQVHGQTDSSEDGGPGHKGPRNRQGGAHGRGDVRSNPQPVSPSPSPHCGGDRMCSGTFDASGPRPD